MSIVSARDQLVAQFAAALDQLLVQTASGEVAAAALLPACQQLARQVGRQLVEAASHLAACHETAPDCPCCHRPMLRHDRQQRPLVSLAGEVNVTVQRWRCRRCRTAATPSWEALEVRRQCAAEVWQPACRLAAYMPFEKAERTLAELGPRLSDNTLQRLAQEVGGERIGAREQEARAVVAMERSLAAETAPERLYLTADGFAARVAGRWREPRVGVIYETAAAPCDDTGAPPPARRRSVVSHLADADELLLWLTAESQRRGIGQAAEVVLVADGAPWIWDRLRQLVPLGCRCTEILDWYHAVEHLAKAVRAAYGEAGNKLELERLKKWLWHGRLPELFSRLRQLAEGVGEGESGAEIRRVMNYFRAHRERLRYQSLSLDGYHVGSGQVESACKQLGQRVRGRGQTWTEEGLNAVLCLLADELTAPAVRWTAA